jgi:hypothetical protein
VCVSVQYDSFNMTSSKLAQMTAASEAQVPPLVHGLVRDSELEISLRYCFMHLRRRCLLLSLLTLPRCVPALSARVVAATAASLTARRSSLPAVCRCPLRSHCCSAVTSTCALLCRLSARVLSRVRSSRVRLS